MPDPFADLSAAEVAPVSLKALAFGEALMALLAAYHDLETAKARVGSYTGQYAPEDLVAREQDAYHRALEAFYQSAPSAS